MTHAYSIASARRASDNPDRAQCIPIRVVPIADSSPGSLSEILGNVDDALFAYEQALRANQNSIPAMNSISAILRTREDFPKAIDYLNNILKIDNSNGEAWGSLGKSTFRPWWTLIPSCIY